MPVTILTRSRVVAAPARSQRYNILDAELKGFGVRIESNGQKFWFLQTMKNGRRFYRSIGAFPAIPLDTARETARELLVQIKCEGALNPATRTDKIFAHVAAEVFRRHGQRWKARTRQVNRDYLHRYILPVFGARQIDEITRNDVQDWFADLHHKPGAANRAAPVLSGIFDRAMAYGYLADGPNPCAGIRRYKRPPVERFLKPDEMALLARLLEKAEVKFPLQVAIVRLIALTGARKSEILTLEWDCYRDDGDGKRHLHLRDSKTGPKTIYLCTPARRILDELPRDSVWVFPAKRRKGPISCINSFWRDLRAGTTLNDVRVHDLRHSYASIALRQGCSLRVIGRLLGHSDPATTLKYTHLDDGQIQDAANMLSSGLADMMTGDALCAAE